MRGVTGAVAFVAQRRLARHWRALAAAGVLLGLGFGLSLASFAAARLTASAYDRILDQADAPDAAVALGQPPEQAEQSLRAIDGITAQRVYAGFLGAADGIDRILTTALLAPIDDPFPVERPTLRAGRLPDPDAPDEAVVNSIAAARGGIEVGQRLHFRFFNPATSASTETEITVVGIGTFPAEAVTDETNVLGVFVFTRAFYDAHRDLVVYAASNVYLAPGFDARRDLAPAVGALGDELQSARAQEQQAVDDALRPLIIVLVALGVLAFGGTTIAAGQVVQRTRDRWLSDDARLRSLGMARGQIVLVELASSALVAALAAAVALVTMWLASPIAPIGPLHDLDPAQGFAVDGTVAALGAVAIVVTIVVLTLVFSSLRNRTVHPMLRRSRWLATMPGGPATAAGLTLALRTDDGRDRAWRAVAATTAAAAGLAMCAAFVSSAIALTDTPARYGFDADLLAVNAYGDQPEAALQRAFGDRDDVAAATGYTEGSYLIDGRAVPGLAATALKGELTPTLLRGRPPRSAGEIVVGQDTLDSIGADVGDMVKVQVLTALGSNGEPAADPVPLRIVGIATFPAVNQVGTDMPRLGIGALVTRDAFLRMHGDPANGPEFTVVRLVDGADPAAVIADNREGFQDAAQTPTAWFTDAKPAELRQLDAATPYLRGALVVGFMILLAVVVHALWTRARANRHDLAVLRVIGCTRSQLDAVTAWQVTPFALGGVLLGIPFGIAVGRLLFRLFAQSLAVVDTASTSAATVAALVIAVLLAAAAADLAAVAAGRRTRTAAVLRQG
jgi:hypothetical protein